jgi:phage terminase small subunit
MSKLLTPKQEAFVQAYHRLGNQRAAYKEAYNAGNMSNAVIDVKASELMNDGKLRVRLSELQERVAKKNEITVETITGMLAKAYKLAVDEKQSSAAVAASMGLGKLHGLIVDKKEDVTIRRTTLEIDARIRQLIAVEHEDGVAGASRRTGDSPEPDEAVPTVSGHGTA